MTNNATHLRLWVRIAGALVLLAAGIGLATWVVWDVTGTARAFHWTQDVMLRDFLGALGYADVLLPLLLAGWHAGAAVWLLCGGRQIRAILIFGMLFEVIFLIAIICAQWHYMIGDARTYCIILTDMAITGAVMMAVARFAPDLPSQPTEDDWPRIMMFRSMGLGGVVFLFGTTACFSAKRYGLDGFATLLVSLSFLGMGVLLYRAALALPTGARWARRTVLVIAGLMAPICVPGVAFFWGSDVFITLLLMLGAGLSGWLIFAQPLGQPSSPVIPLRLPVWPHMLAAVPLLVGTVFSIYISSIPPEYASPDDEAQVWHCLLFTAICCAAAIYHVLLPFRLQHDARDLARRTAVAPLVIGLLIVTGSSLILTWPTMSHHTDLTFIFVIIPFVLLPYAIFATIGAITARAAVRRGAVHDG
jgi:hypothetical protein